MLYLGVFVDRCVVVGRGLFVGLVCRSVVRVCFLGVAYQFLLLLVCFRSLFRVVAAAVLLLYSWCLYV